MSAGRDLSALETGLRAWLTGDESVENEIEAEAAGMLAAETLVLARKWLLGQFENGNGGKSSR